MFLVARVEYETENSVTRPVYYNSLISVVYELGDHSL